MQNDLENLDLLTLKSAVAALEKLEADSGRKQKEVTLLENKDNPALQEFFRRALGKDKYYVTVEEEILSSSPEDRIPPLDSFARFLRALDALRDRKLTGNDARGKVERFLAKCHPQVRKWYQRVLGHDLRIGISKATIEKVYGSGFWDGKDENEFHYHGCCLARKFEDVYVGDAIPEFPLGAEFKLDGERALAFVFPDAVDAKVVFFSRGGLRKTEIEGVDALTQQYLGFAGRVAEVAGLPRNTPIFFDGEFLAAGWNQTSSVVGKTVNFDPEEFLAKTRIVLFDWCPVDTYIKKGFGLAWWRRKKILMSAAGATRAYEKVKAASDNIYVLGHLTIKSMEDLDAFYDRAIDGGFEGIMLKVREAPLQFDRKHKYVVKLKPEDAQTGVIMGFTSGKNQHGPADSSDIIKVKHAMEQHGDVEDDGHYLHIAVDDTEAIAAELRGLVNDERDRRVSAHLDGKVSYRYGKRLGAFIVKVGDDRVNVGGGFTFKAGQDQRMDFWQRREQLLGMKLDFKLQADKNKVAKARFNSFVRLREDLSTTVEEENDNA